jgi:hypothetical protein
MSCSGIVLQEHAANTHSIKKLCARVCLHLGALQSAWRYGAQWLRGGSKSRRGWHVCLPEKDFAERHTTHRQRGRGRF